MSLEKFTAQEIELIEDFLNDAKNTSKNIYIKGKKISEEIQ